MGKNVPSHNRYRLSAIELVDAEIALCEKRIQHPEFFIAKTEKKPISPLHWTATPTEFAELLCALDFCGAICDAEGRKATFTDVVNGAECLFNIRLGEPYDLKRNVLRRKTRLTFFLDKLRRLLNEHSAEF